MASSFGRSLIITIFGESHGPAIGLVVDGLPSGIILDNDLIKNDLEKRHGLINISTSRREEENVEFLSGVFEGKTTGTPLTFIIKNSDVDSSTYHKGDIRPSHADYTNYIKYKGFNDYRGGGFSSGRLTACLVVLGSICKMILKNYSIDIYSHIKTLKNINDDNLDFVSLNFLHLAADSFPVINIEKKKEMMKIIENAKKDGDSVGGELETVIMNCPIGLGEPFFSSFESTLSSLLFSIGGIKGVRFGNCDGFISSYGSEVNDCVSMNKNKIVFASNNSGGVNGGITNGQPIYFVTTIKPTSSIKKEQESINVMNNKNIKISSSGRHDPCLIHRIRYVVEALSYYTILELLMEQKSKDFNE